MSQVQPPTAAASVAEMAALGAFLTVIRPVSKSWAIARDFFVYTERPLSYASGSFVATVFDNRYLRCAAYVTYVVRRILDWNRQLGCLKESSFRFKAALNGTFDTASRPEEKMQRIQNAALLLLDDVLHFFIASLNLVDVFSITSEESLHQVFWHCEDLINDYSSDPKLWIQELEENQPLLQLVFPKLRLHLQTPESFITQVKVTLFATKFCNQLSTAADKLVRMPSTPLPRLNFNPADPLPPPPKHWGNLSDKNGAFQNLQS